MSLKETALALAKGHRLGVALFFLLLPSFAVAPARAELAIDGESRPLRSSPAACVRPQSVMSCASP
jgi:hypothetical protein